MLQLALSPLVALLAAAVTRADAPLRIRDLMRVQQGITCLESEELAHRVEQWLDDTPLAPNVTIVVDGSTLDPHSVHLYVVQDKRTIAQRAFTPGPAQCDHLHAAVALSIAMALKASQSEERVKPRVAEPALAKQPEPTPSRWSLAGAALASYRVLPALAPGLELSVRYALSEHFALRLAAQGSAAFGMQLGANGSYDAVLAAARADGCGRRRLDGALHGALCLGVMGGALAAAGDGVMSPRRASVPLFALAGAAQLALELSPRWSLELGLSLRVLLHRVWVGVEDAAGRRSRSAALPNPGFALGLGPAYHFE